ncbi:MAG TPA: FHA domain-containing protein [Kofleriaceae bacterium]|nr:FHA domain-containing protein [Kofleriaceae bacterium]
MTAKRDLKRRVRERQARTGESYTTALRHVLAAREDDTAEPDTLPSSSEAEQAAKGEPANADDRRELGSAVAKPTADPDATSDAAAPPFEGDELTDPGATRIAPREERTAPTRLDEGAAGAAWRWPDEMNLRPADHASPIDVDEALDFTDAAAELGMKCWVLMFPKLAERADPARVLTAVRDALAATQNDPATELLHKLVFRGEAPRGLVMLTREPRFRQRVEAGFTGVSSDGRVLAIHVDGHQGIVTALGAVWRNTSTLVLMAPDDFAAKLVMPPGTIQELGARYGVPIPAGPIAPMPQTSPGALRGISTRPRVTSAVPAVFLIFNGRRYPITRELFVIGRHNTSDLQIKDGHISRKHAAVFWQDGAHYLVDLGSQAGTEYRGLKIKNKQIEEGDVFSLGEYVLRFTFLDTDG